MPQTSAVGGDLRFTEGTGQNLSLKGDAWLSRFELDGDGDRFMALGVDAQRLRVALEGRYVHALEGGGSVEPLVELGLHHDGGDGETGFGVEAARRRRNM